VYKFELDSRITPFFIGKDAFDQVLKIEGEPYRMFANRRTVRVELGGRGYFFKVHLGVGWKEIFKCLFSFRLPVLGAANEWHAIQRLEELGVATMKIAGFGTRGWNPADRHSFLVTEELAGTVSLEDYCRDWVQKSPPVPLKYALIGKVARVAKQLHENGVNHRDFYICHFHLDSQSTARFLNDRSEPLKLYLIDLHRTQIRDAVPRRWRDKDLVGLYFSAMDIGLSRRDLLRFIRIYTGRSLQVEFSERLGYWSGIHVKACRLYEKVHRRKLICEK
jgi:heptose I phosphotransferase